MVWRKESEWSESNVSTWEYRAEKPPNILKGWVGSYSGYREDVEQPVRRLEIPKNRVILILGFGDRLQISAVGSRLAPSQYAAFVVGLGEEPLIAENDGAQQWRWRLVPDSIGQGRATWKWPKPPMLDLFQRAKFDGGDRTCAGIGRRDGWTRPRITGLWTILCLPRPWRNSVGTTTTA